MVGPLCTKNRTQCFFPFYIELNQDRQTIGLCTLCLPLAEPRPELALSLTTFSFLSPNKGLCPVLFGGFALDTYYRLAVRTPAFDPTLQ